MLYNNYCYLKLYTGHYTTTRDIILTAAVFLLFIEERLLLYK